MNYYRLVEPQKLSAGSVGDKPIFHDCADCGEKEAVIAGYMASGPKFEQMGVIKTGDAFFKLAVFCGPCFEKRLTANEKTEATL